MEYASVLRQQGREGDAKQLLVDRAPEVPWSSYLHRALAEAELWTLAGELAAASANDGEALARLTLSSLKLSCTYREVAEACEGVRSYIDNLSPATISVDDHFTLWDALRFVGDSAAAEISWERGIDHAERILRDQPNDAGTHRVLALRYVQYGDYRLAHEHFEKFEDDVVED